MLKNMNDFVCEEVTVLKKLLAKSEEEKRELSNENFFLRLRAEQEKTVADEKQRVLRQQITSQEILLDDFCKDMARLTVELKHARREAKDYKKKVDHMQIKLNQMAADESVFVHGLSEKLEISGERLEQVTCSQVTGEGSKAKKLLGQPPACDAATIENSCHHRSRRSLRGRNHERLSRKIEELQSLQKKREGRSCTCTSSEEGTPKPSPPLSPPIKPQANPDIIGIKSTSTWNEKPYYNATQPGSATGDFKFTPPPDAIQNEFLQKQFLRSTQSRRARTKEGSKKNHLQESHRSFIGLEISIPPDFGGRQRHHGTYRHMYPGMPEHSQSGTRAA